MLDVWLGLALVDAEALLEPDGLAEPLAEDEAETEVVADAEPEALADGDEDEDEVDDVEPGFRALASVTLPEKPNWAVGVRDPSTQRGVVCVATTGSLVEVLRV